MVRKLIFRRILGTEIPSGPSATFAWAALCGSTGNGIFAATAALFLTEAIRLGARDASFALSAAAAFSVGGNLLVGRVLNRASPRTAMLALCCVRAGLYAILAVVTGLGPLVAVLCLCTTADLVNRPLKQTLMKAVMPEEARRGSFAVQRSISNVAFILGAVIAGVGASLDSDAVLRGLVMANAILFVPMIVLYARLPHTPSERARRRDATDAINGEPLSTASPWRNPRYVLFSACSGTLAIYYVILFFALPLWVRDDTTAPVAMISITWVLNTAITAIGQARWSSRIVGVVGGVRAYPAAGAALAAACGAFYVASLGSAVTASAAILLGGLLLSIAENIHTTAEWEVSFGLAPEGSESIYFATTSGFAGLSEFLGPLIIGAVVLPYPALGWGFLAVAVGSASLVVRRVVRGDRHDASAVLVPPAGPLAVESQGDL